MFRRLVPCLGTAAVALATLLVVAEPAAAQQHGRRGGSSFGNFQWSDGHPGYNARYSSPYYGGSYGPRQYTDGYNPYYPQYSGSGPRQYTDGYNPYYPQYSGSGYAPGAYGYDRSYSSAPSNSYRDDGRMFMYAPESDNTVRISVRVPSSAHVWFEGAETTQTGSLRQFISPPIVSDSECTYEIRAQWTEGGREVDQTRKVSFHAGDRLTVNFMKGGAQGAVVAAPAPAAKAVDKSTHDGKVVSIAEDKLVMMGKNDKEHSHALTADVKMTCDGNACKCEDIKAGMQIRVTTKKDTKQTVTKIEALDGKADFQQRDQ